MLVSTYIAMKVVPASSLEFHRFPLSPWALLAVSAGILTLLASGCYGPAKGPTDPKEFIVQGKQWNNPAPSSTATPPADPSAPAPSP